MFQGRASAQAPREKQTHSLCATEADNKIVFEEGFSNKLILNEQEEGGRQTMVVL